LTYSLGATADDTHFAVDSASGQLKTKGALDYESEDEYTLTVTATDGDGLSASIAVTIRVTDVDETPANRAPVFAAASVVLSVAENTAAGTTIGDAVAATDPDGDALTYSLGSDGHSHRRCGRRDGPGRRQPDILTGSNGGRYPLRHRLGKWSAQD
jgi:hypothetical protein